MLDADVITIFFCSFPTTWLASCDEWIESLDTNKTARSYKVHDVILDDNDPRSLLGSIVKWNNALIISIYKNQARIEIYIIDNSWTMDILSHASWSLWAAVMGTKPLRGIEENMSLIKECLIKTSTDFNHDVFQSCIGINFETSRSSI